MAVQSKQTEEERKKETFFLGVCLAWYFAVVAHTVNLQSDAILIRNACGGDLGKAARVSSIANAVAGILGLVVNQIGGKLSDSMGRKSFFYYGPLAQILTGFACFAKSDSALMLGASKALRMCATTFSGTVMGGAGMRDVFQGSELGVKMSKAGSIIGLAIMTGPLLESIILKRAKAGSERFTFLALAAVGAITAISTSAFIPETLSSEKRKPFELSSALRAANPFGFVKLYTNGSPAVKTLATVATMQTMCDGKNMSDITQIWTREHLKLSVETIRNFLMGYGFASTMAGASLGPYLLKNLSVFGYTTFTNMTNFAAFALRGSVENSYVFFGALPLMLPGVNAASTLALTPVLNKHMEACGFGIGESTAWTNNLRVLAGSVATLAYGYFYSWCRKIGINAGMTFAFAGFLAALLPQVILALADRSILKIADQKDKK